MGEVKGALDGVRKRAEVICTELFAVRWKQLGQTGDQSDSNVNIMALAQEGLVQTWLLIVFIFFFRNSLYNTDENEI